jgi:hypothetical protein
MTAFQKEYRPIFMVVTFGLLGSAFYLTYRPRGATASAGETGSAPVTRVMKLNRVMLWAVTAMAVAFLFFPQAMTSLFTAEDEFTAEMTQTVVQIEGMT